MKFATIAYGKESEWRKPLEAWLEHFTKIQQAPITIACMGEEWIKEVGREHGSEVLSFPIDPSEVHGNLNYSGLLMAHIAKTLSPVLVITLDCEVLKPIQEGNWMHAEIALGIDVFQQRHHHLEELGSFPEYSCSVQWCRHALIGNLFFALWERYINEARASQIPYWEQIIWSAVHAHIKKQLKFPVDTYPLEMNWSSAIATDKDITIMHYHGKRKKDLWKKWGIQ